MNLPVSNAKITNTAETISGNEFGETPLPYAPTITASNGERVVPQQFLDVNRTLGSVENILAQVDVPDNFVLFAGEENGLVYLMCAILGHENYIKRAEQRDQMKVVYGRRWLLEPSTPTSEVVQTALLAVKKAREHELRERVVLLTPNSCVTSRNRNGVRRATPFNCHMDLPMMRQEFTHLKQAENPEWQVEELLERLRVDNLRPRLRQKVTLGHDRVLFEIQFAQGDKPATSFSEFSDKSVGVLCDRGTQAEFLHEFFEALLKISDQFVNEQVKFKGFARFSQSLCPTQIADFSYATRNLLSTGSRFDEHFQDMSYRVDAAKAPAFNDGELGEKQRNTLADKERSYGVIAGYKPY